MDSATLSLLRTVQGLGEQLPPDVREFVRFRCTFRALESRDLGSTLGLGQKRYALTLSCRSGEVEVARAIAAKWLEHTHGFSAWSGHDKNWKEAESRKLTRKWGFSVSPPETDVVVERFQKCRTVSGRKTVLQQVLSDPQENEIPENGVDLQRMYDESRQWIRGILGEHDGLLRRCGCEPLPPLPAYREKSPRSGLDDNVQWCDDAIKVIQKLPARIDAHVIEQTIDLLRELRDLPRSQFPKTDEALLENAQGRAQGIFDRFAARKRYHRRIPFEHYWSNPRLQETASTVAQIARLAADGPLQSLSDGAGASPRVPIDRLELFRHFQFYAAIEKIYRLCDVQYVEGLAKLERSIGGVIDNIKRLDSTDMGQLLDTFETLSLGELQSLYDRIGLALQLDRIVSSALFGTAVEEFYHGESRASLIDKAIAHLTQIQAEGDRLRDAVAVSEGHGGAPDRDVVPRAVQVSQRQQEAPRTLAAESVINIQNFTGIAGGTYQAKSFSVGGDSLVCEQEPTTEKRRGRIGVLLKVVGALIGTTAGILTILYYLDWLGPLKAFIGKILTGG